MLRDLFGIFFLFDIHSDKSLLLWKVLRLNFIFIRRGFENII